MFAVYKRELRSYFTTAIGYVCLAVFLIFFNLFYALMLRNNSSDVTQLFNGMNLYFIMLFIPILTMKLFSEEKRNRTEQLLLTSPVKLIGIVLGKFLSAFSLFALGIIITLPNMVILSFIGTPDLWVMVGNYTGILFLGAALIAIGIFVSGLTENQVVSCITSFAILFMFMIIDQVANIIPFPIITKLLGLISLYNRYGDFIVGIFNPVSILYYISVMAIFLFLTVRMLDKRRWG